MPVYSLKKIDEIGGKIVFYKLVKDDICLFDDFENQIESEGTYKAELNTIQARLIQIANLKTLPKTKYKDITPDKESVKEYEIKTENLRVYLFRDPRGHIVVLGGKKSKQKKDIKKFRNMKKEYLNNYK